MDNVVELKPPGPSRSKAAKPRKAKPNLSDIERALRERQNTIWRARAILELVDYSQPSQETMTWEQWNAVLVSVDGACELLRKIDDLCEFEELAKVGAALRTEVAHG